jgi:hypothetical protein
MLCARRNARLSVLGLVAILVCLAVPAAAAADSVLVRIEGSAGALVQQSTVTLPSTAVAPVGAPDAETCPGASVVGAVDAATSHSWTGTWDAAKGWSLDTVKGASALVSDGRKWLVFVGDVLRNEPPCQLLLENNDTLTLYPACLGATTTKCLTKGFLELSAPSIVSPGTPIGLKVSEVVATLDAQGNGTSQRGPSLGTSVYGPNGSTLTDSRYGTGTATLTVADKGPATLTTSKPGFAGDQAAVCATDGADGFCGTSIPPQVPFDPYAFCKTTGTDGYCGSPDQVAPVGHVGYPAQAFTFSSSARPKKLSGTVDFDPSQTDHVDLRLMRKTTVTVKKVVKRKVWVAKKVHGKRVRKRVTKRVTRNVKQPGCVGWNVNTSTWKLLKKCDASIAPRFRADGAEVWSYAFLNALPTGGYTVDALATDGAGNTDSTPEVGRNRVTFTVK